MDINKIQNKRLGRVILGFLGCLWVLVLLLVLLGIDNKVIEGSNRIAALVIRREIKLPLLTMAQPYLEKKKDNRSFNTGEIIVPKDFHDFAVSGFYQPLIDGEYELSFTVTPMCSGEKIAEIDISSNNGKKGHGSWEIVGKEVGIKQTETHRFKADFAWDYEFRVFSAGLCGFEVNSGKIKVINIDYEKIYNRN